ILESGAILLLLGWIATDQGDTAAAHSYLADAVALGPEGFQLGRGKWYLAECARRLAYLAAKRRKFEQALRLDGAVSAWFARRPFTPSARLQATWHQRLIEGRRVSGAAAADAALEAGRKISL